MTEHPVRFGPEASLVGMLTQPDSPERSRVAFLMLNAGLISRIGPHRFNVKLARALAGVGQTSLRFDLAGFGDSRATSTGADFTTQAVRDIVSAMDFLGRSCGIHRFALVGICSGAVNAFAAALVDPRVVGALMVDGHIYRTHWTTPVRRWKRFRAASWSEVSANLRRRLLRVLTPGGVGAGDVADDEEFPMPVSPPRAEFVVQVQALADRDVAVFFMYSGSCIEDFSYGAQFRHAFRREGFLDQVRCDYRPDIDHTMISLEAQRKVIDAVLGWVPAVQQACGVTTSARGAKPEQGRDPMDPRPTGEKGQGSPLPS